MGGMGGGGPRSSSEEFKVPDGMVGFSKCTQTHTHTHIPSLKEWLDSVSVHTQHADGFWGLIAKSFVPKLLEEEENRYPACSKSRDAKSRSPPVRFPDVMTVISSYCLMESSACFLSSETLLHFSVSQTVEECLIGQSH